MLWDLILSAEWFEDDLMKRLDYLSERILGDFDIDCMLHFSGIITYTVTSSHPLLEMLRVVQENNRIGKYSDLGQGYVIVDSHSELAQLIIPLNNSEILVPA